MDGDAHYPLTRRSRTLRGVSQLPPPHQPPGIELRGVTRSYGSVPALRGIDLVVQPGETVALLGPNGAGKSTTLDLVLGLGHPDRGSVEVFGLPPAGAVQRGWIGAMLQTGAVISELSVREVLTMLASLYPDPTPVDDVIAAADIADIAGRRTNRLSGGQTQRVRFALALVSNPRLLVLDEPTVALDVESRRSFWATMRGFASDGRTVVFATHYLEEADAYADRIVLMANGVIVADGSTTEIKARVGRRTIRATLPDVAVTELATLPGVVQAERHGDTVELICTDSDTTIRALLAGRPAVHDIEIRGAALEDAFVELTAESPELVEVGS
jgi:ABC-2 type transport system ATP-binding protein